MNLSKSLDRRLLRAVTTSLLAGALALPSASVLAAPSPSASPAEAGASQEPDPAVAQSRSLFEQGLDAYDAEDYAGAARSWTEAHALMAQTPELSESRRVLGFDLAQAQMRAYEQDNDPSRVAAAKPLLKGFVAWVDWPGHTMDESEKQDRLRAIELLSQIESESENESEAPPATAVPPPAFIPPTAVSQDAPPPASPKPNGTGLLIGGGLALAGGVASTIAVFVALGSGRAAEDEFNRAMAAQDDAGISAANRDGRRANIGVLTAASSAVLLGAAGVTMLALGARRRKRSVSASAALSPSSATASVSVRF